MLVGVRGHDVGKGTVSDLAKKIGSMNFPSMQLALGKAITNFDASYGKLSPGMANYVRALSKMKVLILLF